MRVNLLDGPGIVDHVGVQWGQPDLDAEGVGVRWVEQRSLRLAYPGSSHCCAASPTYGSQCRPRTSPGVKGYSPAAVEALPITW
jgi:hypothetical protein